MDSISSDAVSALQGMLSDAAATISTCDLLQKLVAHNNQSEPIPAHSSRYRLSDWCRSFVRRA